jgi:arsenite methyltransferase
MAASSQDECAQWLLQRRHGGDAQEQHAMLTVLHRYREAVLAHAQLAAGDVLLDVGTGDGLIAFGALPLVGEQGKVIFSDISQDLLAHCRALAQQLGVQDRCAFLQASAEDLSALEEGSVDVVTTRSVLVFVSAKQQAFHEFQRVLKSGGWLSIFEPINRFCYPEPAHHLWGYDVSAVQPLARKVRAVYDRLQPPTTDPMLDFDERDLFRWAEQVGFAEIHLDLQVETGLLPPSTWEVWVHKAGNPRIPTREEAMQQALTAVEVEQLTAQLRPQVEQGKGSMRSSVAYLWARK